VTSRKLDGHRAPLHRTLQALSPINRFAASMTLAFVLALIAAVVAVCVTILHGWIFALRRSDRTHLWLAVTGLGVAGMGVGTAHYCSLWGTPDSSVPSLASWCAEWRTRWT
jgi:hypothetical protein